MNITLKAILLYLEQNTSLETIMSTSVRSDPETPPNDFVDQDAAQLVITS